MGSVAFTVSAVKKSMSRCKAHFILGRYNVLGKWEKTGNMLHREEGRELGEKVKRAT